MHRRFSTLLTGVAVATLAVLVSTCRLDELIKTPVSGTLAVAPGAISDSAAVGSSALRLVALELTTVGTARLSFRAASAQASGWIALDVTSGMAPDTLTVTFDPAGLAAGSYQDRRFDLWFTGRVLQGRWELAKISGDRRHHSWRLAKVV